MVISLIRTLTFYVSCKGFFKFISGLFTWMMMATNAISAGASIHYTKANAYFFLFFVIFSDHLIFV